MPLRLFPRLRGVQALALFLAGVYPGAAATFTVPQLPPSATYGNPSAWEDRCLKVAIMSRIAHVGVQNDPTGAAELRMGWNLEGLHIVVRAFDPDRFESGSNSLYRGDSLELFVSPAVGARDFLQILAAPGIIGSKNESPRSAVIGYGAFKNSSPAIKVAGGPEKEGYILDVIVPWKSLNLTPEKGREVGFQLVVNDRDVEMADIADYTKRNNQIGHLCWFPDRSTATDPTRMHTLLLGESPGPAVSIWTDIASDFSSLHVGCPLALAGKTLTVTQGSELLGTERLQPDPESRLSKADISLKPPNPNGPPFELKADGEVVGHFPLYAKMKEKDAAAISQILNAGDEGERLECLRLLQKKTSDPLLQGDIQILLPLVEIWADGREMAEAGKLLEPSEYLSSSVNPMSPPAIRADSPLYPLYCLFRTRNLVWRSIQGGYPEEVAEYYDLARSLLTKAKAMVPNNPVINMYLGEPQPWPGPAEDPNAPQWANYQRCALEQLTELVYWWIDERQMPGGSYGGGWNDDVEMWRNWWPVMLAFQDEKAEAAQIRLSSAIFKQPHMAAGYSSIMSDVEHSSEDSADTLTPMLYLRPNDPVWKEKAKNITKIMREVWTAKNDHGNLAFKNIFFNCSSVGKDPKNGYDTTLDARAAQPALVYWQMTRDPELGAFFAEWLSTWVQAAAAAQNGKPAGVLPTAIHYPDQRIGGPNKWWDTEANSRLYNWPEYVGDMLQALVTVSLLTGEERYLEPVRSMAKLRLDYLSRHPAAVEKEEVSFTSFGRYWKQADLAPGLEPGSRDWCAAQMGMLLPGPIAGYRLLSGDKQFDEVLRQDGDGYVKFLLNGERRELEKDLASVAAAFSVNKPAYTSEVRWTDRVFRFTSAYLESFMKEKLPLPNTRLLYETLTGDPSTWVGSRLAAVRWRTPPKDIAALVTETGKTGFKAELYHFGAEPREFAADLLLLQKGQYDVLLRTAGSTPKDLMRSSLTVSEGGAEVKISLPPQTLCELVIRAVN